MPKPSTLLRRAAFLCAIVAVCPLHAALVINVIGFQHPGFPHQYAPGTTITLRAVKSDPPSTTLQWRHNDVPIPGATDLELELRNLSAADAGNYQLVDIAQPVYAASNTLTINVLAFPASPVDRTFTYHPASAADSRTSVLGFFADGRAFVRSIYRPDESVRYHYRILRDGTVDRSFTYPSGNSANFADFLAVYPADGRVLLSASQSNLNRLAADGSPSPYPVPVEFTYTNSGYPYMPAATVDGSGRALLAIRSRLARLNPDDRVDAGFSYVAPLDAQIRQLKLDRGTHLYVSLQGEGAFQNHPGASYRAVVRLNYYDGTEDPSFKAFYTTTHWVQQDLLVFPLNDSRVLVFGRSLDGPEFTMLKSTGEVDSAWHPSGLPSYLDADRVAVDPAGRLFFIDLAGIVRRALITATGLVPDSNFYPGNGLAQHLSLTPDGLLLVGGSFDSWDGQTAAGLVRLRSTDSAAVPPTATSATTAISPRLGDPIILQATLSGSGPLSCQWLALDGQALPSSATSPTLSFKAETGTLGRYQLRVTGPGGVALGDVIRVAQDNSDNDLPYLSNLSGRCFVGTGDNTAIAGFGIGNRSNHVAMLMRGAGPALQAYGVAQPLPNPVLNLYRPDGSLVANNDTWDTTPSIAETARLAGAFPFAAGSHDAAIPFPPTQGNFTLQLTDVLNNSGIGLLEIYQIKRETTGGYFSNLSLRARTAPGEKVATAGFVVVDPLDFGRPLRVLLRVAGPALASSGVAFPLADPVLTLRDAKGGLIATNNDWSASADAALTSSTAAQVGAFPFPVGSKDAALLIDLPPGVYSVQATGASGTPDTGVTLIEIYLVR